MRVDEALRLGFDHEKEEDEFIYRWVDVSIPGRLLTLTNLGYEAIDPVSGDVVEPDEETGEFANTVRRGNLLLMRVPAVDRAGKSNDPKAIAALDEKVAETDERLSDEEVAELMAKQEKEHKKRWEKAEKATEKAEAPSNAAKSAKAASVDKPSSATGGK